MGHKPSIKITWMSNHDINAVIPLLSALYQHDTPDAPLPEHTTIATHAAHLLKPSTPHKLAIGWTPQGTAIGLAAVGFFISVSDPRPANWQQVELKELFVLPEYRDAGVGAALLNWVEIQATEKGACRMDWHVKADNTRAISFYEKHGGTLLENRLSMRLSIEAK